MNIHCDSGVARACFAPTRYPGVHRNIYLSAQIPLQNPSLVHSKAHTMVSGPTMAKIVIVISFVLFAALLTFAVYWKTRKRAEKEAQDRAQSSFARTSSKPILCGQTLSVMN
jgi:hypothetical protein